mgnify:CR=1 FL=1
MENFKLTDEITKNINNLRKGETYKVFVMNTKWVNDMDFKQRYLDYVEKTLLPNLCLKLERTNGELYVTRISY